jgi:bleomycin hydrolase
MRLRLVALLSAITWLACPVFDAFGQVGGNEPLVLEPPLKDAVLEKIKEKNKKWTEERDKQTEAIRARQKGAKEKREKETRVLRASLPEGESPSGVDVFCTQFHFEPQAQYMTGTCWAFAATSFLESEVFRMKGKKVKLSEMHSVYWEYVEKARRFVRERGDSVFAEGSQHNAVTRMLQLAGAVPLEAYRGCLSEDGIHDHSRMIEEMDAFLHFVKEKDLWDEEWVVQVIRSLLDRTMGPPPQEFKFEGKKYTPKSFAEKVLGVVPDDYVQFVSTMKHPFHASVEFEVPDNWWHDASYLNVPLDEFYAVVIDSVRKGFTVAIGGDVSEPGKDYPHGTAFVPSFDIPAQFISQEAREYRMEMGATGDDHGVHLVGHKEMGERAWFLIKDSGRSARHGPNPGYYFFRDDFIRLKMLSVMVHKEAVKDLLDKLGTAPQGGGAARP